MSQLRRSLHAVVLVGTWMAIGWLFHLDPNSYLLVGVPLVLLFQIFVRKKPLVTLWVRDATQFRLDFWGIVLALALAAWPTIDLIGSLKTSSSSLHLPEGLWSISCIAGAFCAAFSLCRFTKQTWRELLLCLATAGVIGCAMMAAGFLMNVLLHKQSATLTASQALMGIKSFLLYLPVSFVLEEVAFRGAIDAHIQQPGDKHAWLSAIFVSALWGLWHLPIVRLQDKTVVAHLIVSLIALAVLLPLIHSATGVFLSFGWRRSGNLAVPAAAHALIDAVRNMLLQ